MIRTTLYICILLVFASCADEKKKTEPEVKQVETKFEHKAGDIAATFKEERDSDIFKSYIALKTAFVNTDAVTAAREAASLKSATEGLDLDESALNALETIAQSKDVEEQRKAFVAVTSAVEKLMEDALDEGVIYKQYCPMAFKNTGAYWLSESHEIANPYFGDKMYRCGRVTDTLQ